MENKTLEQMVLGASEPIKLKYAMEHLKKNPTLEDAAYFINSTPKEDWVELYNSDSNCIVSLKNLITFEVVISYLSGNYFLTIKADYGENIIFPYYSNMLISDILFCDVCHDKDEPNYTFVDVEIYFNQDDTNFIKFRNRLDINVDKEKLC